MQPCSGNPSLPASLSGNDPASTAVAPAPDDPSATFHDYLQQEADHPSASDPSAPGGTDGSTGATATSSSTSSDASQPDGSFFAAATKASALTWATTADESTTPGLPPSTPPASTPALGLTKFSSLFDAGPVKSAPVAPDDAASAATLTSGNTGATTLPVDSPLATLLARATLLTANARRQANAAPADPTATSSGTTAGSTPSFALGLSLFQSVGKNANSSTPAEKKSTAGTAERSFLQAPGQSATTPDITAQLLAGGMIITPQATNHQLITGAGLSTEKGLGGIGSGASSSAGTTNGKNNLDMNATLEMPGLITSSGTNPLVAKTSADVHILLGTNHDFNEAIDQIMHVAELSNLSQTSNPLRVAIEIQTPPGAIVNVYVSRQADSSYRAQLSTNDVQALGWVQNQIGSLKTSTNSGTDIRWSPAQLDVGTTSASLGSSSTGTGSDRNLDWNRGGNSGGSPDEQPSRQRHQSNPDESDEADFGIPFLQTLGSIRSAV